MTPARAARRTRRAMTTPPARATRCRENRRQAIPKAVRPAPSRAPTRAGARETSVIADPGVEVDVGDVHQEVRDDDHEGDDHDDALGDGVVASQGQLNTVSVRGVPASTPGTATPRTVTRGMRALRTAWRRTTTRGGRPLAWAVRM